MKTSLLQQGCFWGPACLLFVPVFFHQKEETRMVTALVLLNVERDKINSVAEKLTALPGVTEVYSVAGKYDLAAIIRAKENDELAAVVTEHIRRVEGIERSETLIAFRVFSRYDLEMAFSIGLEEANRKQ